MTRTQEAEREYIEKKISDGRFESMEQAVETSIGLLVKREMTFDELEQAIEVGLKSGKGEYISCEEHLRELHKEHLNK